MRVHIANCSKQPHDFIYWVPENDRPLVRNIPIGGQIALDGSKDVLEGIIGQHRKYGLIDIKEIDRAREFHGIAFSFDKPIVVEQIVHAVEKNDEALQLAGDEVRKAAMIALDENAQTAAAETQTKLLASEAEIIEQPSGPNDRGPKMSQKLEVVPEGQAPSAVRRGRGRPRKA
jgi:hypothetical protein